MDKNSETEKRDLLERLFSLSTNIAVNEGRNTTTVPFLSVYRRSAETPSACSSILTPSFCLVVNGVKRLFAGTDMIDYTSGEFLVSVIDIPVSGQVTCATTESPYIGLCVDFALDEMISVAMESKITLQADKKLLSAGTFVGKADTAVIELFVRLLQLNNRSKKAAFLSTLYRRELLFELLSGDYGHLFARYIMLSRSSGIINAIAWIKENLNQSFTAESLAKTNGISVSALQHGFKILTKMGPLKYQKQLRLQEARRLMLNDSLDAAAAAFKVGYESPSQFSREYRRQFGLPPLQDIKALRNVAAPYGV